LSNLTSEGLRFDLAEGGVPVAKPIRPWRESSTGISLTAGNENQLAGLLRGLANKHGLSGPKAEAFVAELLSQATVTESHAPAVSLHLSLGSEDAQRSMIKACLVLWEKKVGNAELNHSRYDEARKFVSTGQVSHSEKQAPLCIMDHRNFDGFDEQFGTNPNSISVCSNGNGKVYGYFRLYNAIGWRFLLCEQGSPPVQSSSLVSNPFDNRVWKCYIDELPKGLTFDWLSAIGNEVGANFPNVIAAFDRLRVYAYKKALDRYLNDMVETALRNAGIKEGDLIAGPKGEAFVSELSKRAAEYFLKLPTKKRLKPPHT